MALKLVQITDCHLGASTPEGFDQDTQTRLTAVVGQLKDQPDIDRILLTGDLAQFGDPSQYDALSALLKPLNIPQSWIAGNHDEANALERFPEYAERVVPLGEKWGLILLNSIAERDGKGSGSLGADELTWLKSVLDNTREQFSYLLIAVHHPPVPVGSEWQDAISLGDTELFVQSIKNDDRIRGILCGHLHQEHALYLDHTPVWVTPATAHQYVPFTETPVRDHDPLTGLPAYRTILLNSNGQIDTWVERVSLS